MISKAVELEVACGYWGEHHKHSLEEWKYEVENDYTRHGYWEWVANRVENEDAG